MTAIILMDASAGILLILGGVHLFYTFFGPKLLPRDPALQARMSQVSPILSNQTTMWRAWIGFNASHSMGAILFGLVYGFLATAHSEVLFNSPYLIGVGFLVIVGYCALGKLYWFSIPFGGIVVSAACFVAGVISSMI